MGKNTIIVLAVLMGLVFVTTVNAQESQTGIKSQAGIKGGLNLSNMTVDDNDDSNLKVGFHVGVFDKIAVSEIFAIQPELLYSEKGMKFNYDESVIADGDTKFKLRYIDLPVKLVFNLTEDLNFQVGPYVSYLVSANADTDADVFDAIDIDSDDELDRDNFHSFDYGVTAGLGFDLDPVIIGLNYDLGLNPVAKDDEAARAIIGDAKNTNIQVYVGFKF